MEAVLELGLTTDIETAASIIGIGRSKAYALAKDGDFPVRIIRVGRSYLVPVPAILELLGVSIGHAPRPRAGDSRHGQMTVK